ncbi:hypothetical protein CU633_18055 [Bacillus sp. V3-13]|nr:hypothetical protein CU633_18055 [Bacillus sp. V3-13]
MVIIRVTSFFVGKQCYFNISYLFHALKACGVCGKNTKDKLVEILVFKQSARFCEFNADSDNCRNKEQINEIEICIAISYGMSKHVL